ncbi:MAG: ATP-binding cassette domain-containing protein [Pseudomonadota bacterium]
MIAIENLGHQHGNVTVLRDINLVIPKSGITALIGPNGAGKSTLLSLMARLEPIQTGRITVDDLTLGKCSTKVLARRLAILPQSSDAGLRLTVRELVAFGRYPHHAGHPGPEDDAITDKALALFGLEPIAQRRTDSLSGGQRQRVLLAMVYAQDTDYILLDEPLNNLDMAAAGALMAILQRLCTERQKTIVIVLHDVNYASLYADKIVTLKDGQLGPTGHPTSVLVPETLRSVFGVNARVRQIEGRPFVLPA